MNVQQILHEVGLELQHEPDVPEVLADRRRVLARVHRELCQMREWPWLIREQDLLLVPDLVVDSGEFAMLVVGAGTSERILTVARDVLTDAGLGDEATERASMPNLVQLLQQGATLGVETFALGAATGWGNGPFVVDSVTDAQAYAPGLPAGVLTIALEPRAELTLGGSEGNLVVSWPRYLLPHDLAMLLDVTLTDGRELRPVSAKDYAWITRQGSTAGPPQVFTFDQGFVPYAPMLSGAHADAINYPAANQGGPAVRFDTAHAARNMEITTVIEGAFASGGSTVGFRLGHRYRAFVCWMAQGHYGPPSNILSLEVTDNAERSLVLSNLPILPDSTFTPDPWADIGWKLAAFVAEDDEPFVLWDLFGPDELPYQTDPAVTVSVTSPAKYQTPWKRVRWDEWFTGVPRYLRVHPKPAERTAIRLRYRARPPELLSLGDSPWFHPDFHEYLVHATVAAIAGRDKSAALHQRATEQARRSLARMMAAYLPEQSTRQVRGRIDQPRRPIAPRVVVDWNGDT